jgi:two-component system, NarL family, nitrate/nitrite response regulator NarL
MIMRSNNLPQDSASPAVSDFPVRVLIVSEVRFLRESLAEFLGRDNSISISGLFDELEGFLARIHAGSTDIVLLDEAFTDGPAVIGRIRNIAPQILVIVIAVAETAENIITWAEAGVAGYVPRTAGLAEIVPILVEIRHGKQPCLASVAAGLLRRLYNVDGPNGIICETESLPKLTVRETEIAQLIAEGMSNKDIARRLDIGVATAKTHVHNLLRKLNLRRRGQTVMWMREHRDRLSRSIRPRVRLEGESRFAEEIMLEQKHRAGA